MTSLIAISLFLLALIGWGMFAVAWFASSGATRARLAAALPPFLALSAVLAAGLGGWLLALLFAGR